MSQDAEKRWSARERFARKKKSKKGLFIGLGVGAVAIAGGLWAIQPERGGEPDIEKVAANFAEAWEEGDVRAMAGMHHPSGRADFEKRLERIFTGRWADGAPKVVSSGAQEEPAMGFDDSSAVRKAITAHHIEGGLVAVRWQFDAPRERWYIYAFDLPPPDVASRLEAFTQAWSQSSPDALEPFFAPGSEEKMAALVEREAEKRGWAGSFPALGEVRLDPDPQRLAMNAAMGVPQKIDALFEDDILVRWKVHEETDSWCISGFKFP